MPCRATAKPAWPPEWTITWQNHSNVPTCNVSCSAGCHRDLGQLAPVTSRRYKGKLRQLWQHGSSRVQLYSLRC